MHEQHAATRTVVLVFQGEIRGTRPNTESARRARVDSTLLGSERRVGERAFRAGERRVRHESSPRMPGFSTPAGSNAFLIPMESRSLTGLPNSFHCDADRKSV